MKTIAEIQEENRKLKALCRYLYLTLGYYGTPCNYKQESIIYHPISGEAVSGIIADGGKDARHAQAIATELLGHTAEEIGSWDSVFNSIQQSLEFSREK